MNRFVSPLLIAFLAFVPVAVGQAISQRDLTEILKAENARRYDTTLENMLKSPKAGLRKRAALAAGRIGDAAAVGALAQLVTSDPDDDVRVMAAFGLGEIESADAADVILELLRQPNAIGRGRLVEAAGKVAAANPKTAKAKALGDAILDTLEAESARGSKQDREVVLLALTAALRARPDESDIVVMKFLTNLDARVRADAGNTLARLRSKSANPALRAMLMSDNDAIARANAARALGAAADRASFDMLLVAATEDADSRVRVSAIRSLAALKDAMAIDKLLDRGGKLLAAFRRSKFRHPVETNELLEIASTLGRLAQNTNDDRTIKFLRDLRRSDKFRSPETAVAIARVDPEGYVNDLTSDHIGYADWHVASAFAQGAAEIATLDKPALKRRAAANLAAFIDGIKKGLKPAEQRQMRMAMPDLIRSLAALKPDNMPERLRSLLTDEDVFIRATAAQLIGELPFSDVNMAALRSAATAAFAKDKIYNDAELAIMDAAFSLNRKESLVIVEEALNSPDFLVRRKAFDLLKMVDPKESPNASAVVAAALSKGKDHVLPYSPASGTKLGQVLDTDADYRRAAGRKNGGAKAVLTTEKGSFTIDLLPDDAPLTVDNFIKLAKARYFNGLEVHRVVPNFVMQDGDPRGDGNGGPGWSIRCEVNMVPYGRGAVGMALSGKDTGGSQWFVTHSPQPHLDGGYTVFGKVNETGMKVVDNIVRGDKVISVRIVGR